WHAGKLKPQPDIFGDRAPWQQRKLLEHHGDSLAAQLAQLGFRRGHDIDRSAPDINDHLAALHLIKSVHRADQRRFPGARKPHQHRDLAMLDGKARTGAADDGTRLERYLFAAFSRFDQRHGRCLLLVGAEHDIDITKFDCRLHFRCSRPSLVTRSRMMARTTIARPASMPSGMLTLLSARTTGLPSPFAPISAAITTIESESMMHCVSPVMIEGRAAGSSTFQRSWRLVAPKASPASFSGTG